MPAVPVKLLEVKDPVPESVLTPRESVTPENVEKLVSCLPLSLRIGPSSISFVLEPLEFGSHDVMGSGCEARLALTPVLANGLVKMLVMPSLVKGRTRDGFAMPKSLWPGTVDMSRDSDAIEAARRRLMTLRYTLLAPHWLHKFDPRTHNRQA